MRKERKKIFFLLLKERADFLDTKMSEIFEYLFYFAKGNFLFSSK
jgi:hypothetical protein